VKRATLVLTVFIAAGCSSDHEDLRQWMAENTKDMRPSIAKLPPAQPYANKLKTLRYLI
jgi:type IV pilus assembly protein PilP